MTKFQAKVRFSCNQAATVSKAQNIPIKSLSSRYVPSDDEDLFACEGDLACSEFDNATVKELYPCSPFSQTSPALRVLSTPLTKNDSSRQKRSRPGEQISPSIIGHPRLRLSDENGNNDNTVSPPKLERKSSDKAPSPLVPQKVNVIPNNTFYGLPMKVKHLLMEQRKISNLYDWQDECLRLPGLLQRRNLIYSLPTSGGKTLVAEILMLQQVLLHQKNVLFILPFVSIVQEKVRALSSLGAELGFFVEEYAGNRGHLPPIRRRKRHSVYVATIEKAHSIINCLLEPPEEKPAFTSTTKSESTARRLSEIGLVVVDELHMIAEGGHRGAALEIAITKVLISSPTTQIIGMSATLSNIGDLVKFLNADLYMNEFRPVELTEYVKIESQLFSVSRKVKHADVEESLQFSRQLTFPYDKSMLSADPDHIAGLVSEVVPQHSCLVFCPTKKQCEHLAKNLCNLMPPHFKLSEPIASRRRQLLQQLQSDNEGPVCSVLSFCIPFGVAYHHSGLTREERVLIESAYCSGTLCLLCCTSTLAAGVNLPAKRVIIRSPYVGRNFLQHSQYKQMIGRAGRAGWDSCGESVLVLKREDREKFLSLLTNEDGETCRSSLLYDNGKGLRQLLLSLVSLQLATDSESLYQRVVQRTLWHIQQPVTEAYQEVCTTLKTLLKMGLLIQVRADSTTSKFNLKASTLGRAVIRGSLDIDRAKQLYHDLAQAQESLSLSSHLHLLYLATPYEHTETLSIDMVNWSVYSDRIATLSKKDAVVLPHLGITEETICRRAAQMRVKGGGADELVLRRFYLTLMLHDLWNQQTVWLVAERYQQNRGTIQQLLQSASTLATCLGYFVQEMEEFWCYQLLFPEFAKRLSYCVNYELIPLMELPGVKKARAKLMYEAGFKTVANVAHANVAHLVANVKHLTKKAARQMVDAAKLKLRERAETLQEEAEELLMPTAMLTLSDSGERDILKAAEQFSPDIYESALRLGD